MNITLIDQHVTFEAAKRGQELALGDAPNRSEFFSGASMRLTWSELDQAVDGTAALLASHGVEHADAVAIQLPNVVELAVTLLACFRIGATAVPLPIQYRDHEVSQCLVLTKPAVLVSANRPDRPDQMARLTETNNSVDSHVQLVDVEHVTSVLASVLGSEQTGTTTPTASSRPSDRGLVEQGAIKPNDVKQNAVVETDVATVCWTSGTTGSAKGVPRNHSMWLASGGFQVEQLGLRQQDRLLCPFPIVNMAGIGGMVVPWLLSGSTLFLHQPLDLAVFLQQVVAEQITYTVAPPPLLNMLLANPAMIDGVDMSSLTRIASGSAPLDQNMVAGWSERGVEIVNVFGSNEGAALLSTAANVPDPTERARFFPRPNSFNIKTRLVDVATGQDITGPGVSGELRFSGPTVFGGYLGSDGEEFDDQGYFCTGDVFEWSGDAEPPNLLRFVDRLKDIIIRGGMNIAAAEIEGLLASHADVAECAAVGYPDVSLGERLGVFVVAASENAPTLESIVEHLKMAGVASFKLPERVEVVSALPRNPVGKVLKPDLRNSWAS